MSSVERLAARPAQPCRIPIPGRALSRISAFLITIVALSGCGTKPGEWAGITEKLFGDLSIDESSAAVATSSSPASQLVFTCAPRSTQAGSEWKWNVSGCLTPQGVPGGIRVEIRNSKGERVVGGYSATNPNLNDSAKSVELSLVSGSGDFEGSTSVSASSGIADFSGSGLGLTSAGTKRIRATMVNSAGATLVKESSAFQVLPRDEIDTQDGIVVLTNPSTSAVAGVGLGSMPSIELRDVYGNRIDAGTQASVSAVFSSVSGDGFSGTGKVTASKGLILPRQGQFSFSTVGEKILQVAITTAKGVVTRTFDPINVTHGTPSKLEFVWPISDQSVVAGSTFPVLPIIRVLDNLNNVVRTGSGASASISIKLIQGTGVLSGSAVSGGVYTANATNGVLDLSSVALNVNQTGSNKRLRAQAVLNNRTTTVTSSAFNVGAGAASGSTSFLTAMPSGGGKADGVAKVAITLNLRDAAGNIVTGISGASVSLATSDLGVTIPAFTKVSDSLGRLTTSITSTEPGQKAIRVASPSGLASTPSLTVTFIPGPVVAYNSTITGMEDGGTIGGTARSSDTGSLVRTFSTVAAPTKGTLLWTNSNTGEFTYQPYQDSAGADSFSFRVSDTRTVSNTATVFVSLTPVNDPPIAIPGVLSVVAESFATGTLTAQDPDGPSKTFSIVNSPVKGTLSLTSASTGVYRYTPNAQTQGADTFTFQVSDGEYTSDPATIRVTINPSIPGAPTTLAGAAIGPESISLTWSDNSWNEDDFVIEQAVGAASTAFTFTTTADANATSLTMTGLTPGTTYRFRAKARNTAGLSAASNIVNISTPSTPGAPQNLVANPGNSRIQLMWGPASGQKPIQYRIQRSLTETGPFTTITSLTSSATSGSLTYWNNGLTNNTTYYYRVVGSNSFGQGIPSPVVSVTPIGPPQLNYAESPYTLTRTVEHGGIIPVNNGGPASSCGIMPGLPDGLEVTETCIIQGIPNEYSFQQSYTIDASNAVGSGAATFLLQVNELPPSVIYAANSFTLSRGAAIDPIAPTTFEYVASYGLKAGSPELPSGLELDPLTGTITGTVVDVIAPMTVTFTAVNITGQSLDVPLSFEVPNSAPTLDPVESFAVGEDFAPFTVTLTGIGTGSPTELDTLVVTATSSNPGVLADPTVTYASPDSGGTLSFVANPNAFGEAVITVQVDDGMVANNTVVQSFTITVNSINDAPTLAALSNRTILEDAAQQTVTLSGIGTGADNEFDTLVVSATSSNPGLIPNPTIVYSSPNATGTLRYTPVADGFGTAVISVVVNDGGAENSTVTRTFTVTVDPVNDAPTLAAIGNLTILEDDPTQTVTLTGITTGAANENDTLSVTATSSNPAIIPNPTLSYTSANATGTLQFAPVANANGTVTMTVVVNDGQTQNNTVTRTFVVNVTPVNDAPTLTSISTLGPSNEDTSYTISYASLFAASNAADIEGDTLSFRVEAVSTGTLTKGGVAVTAGTTLLSSGQSLVWTPAQDANGVLNAFTVKAWDGQDPSTTAVQVKVNVTPVNDAPTLAAVSDLTILEDAAAQTVTLTGITTGATNESDTLSVTVTSSNTAIIPNPTLSYTSANATGTLQFAPVANANGTVTMTVVVNDGQAQNNTVTRTFVVNVTPVNDAPTLTSVSTLGPSNEDTSYTISYASLFGASNAADIEGDTISFRVEAVSTGTLTKGGVAVTAGSTLLSAGESIVWTSAQDANALLNAFTVKAWDGQDPSTTAVQVQVNVTPVNDAPTLAAISDRTILEDASTQTVTLTGITTGAANENDTLSVTVTSSNTAIIPNPSVSYTSPNATGTLQFTPVANANGTVTMTVVVNDGQAQSSTVTRTFVVNVTPVNDAPTLTSISTLGPSNEDTSYTISYASLFGASNAADIEGDTLSFRVEAVSTGTLTKGGVAVTAGSTLLSAGESIVWTSAQDANGVLNAFTVKAWDGQDPSTTAVQVRVNVTPVNDAPTLAAISDRTILEDASTQTVTLTGITTGAANESDTLSVTVTSSNTAIIPNPSLSYTSPNATGTLQFTPLANANGTVTMTVVVNDGQAQSNTVTRTFVVNVTPVNDPPTLTSISTLGPSNEDTSYTISYASLFSASNAADIEGDTISFRVEAVSTGTLTKGGVAVTAGTTLLSAGQTLVWTPAANANGLLAAFTVRASDGQDVSTSVVPVRVNVTPVNDAPTLAAISDATILEDAAAQTITLTGITTGAANEADTLSVTVTSSNTAIIPNPTLSYTSANATGTLQFTPIANANGTVTMTVVVSDGQAQSSTVTRTFVVNVTPVNDPPTLTLVGDFGPINEDTSITLTHSAFLGQSDAADIEGDVLSFRVEAVSSGTLMKGGVAVTAGSTLLGPGEQLVWTPAANANGLLAAFTVRASDGQDVSTSVVPVRVNVTPVNDAPTLAAISDATILEDAAAQTITLTGITTGAANEADTLSVTVTSSNTAIIPNPSLSYTSPNATGTLQFTPVANANGTVTMTVVVNDGQAQNNTITRTFVVNITPVNDAPTLAALSSMIISEGAPTQTVTLSGISTGAANENDTLVVSATSSNPSLIPNPSVSYTSANATGTLSFTPVDTGFGTVTITVQVDDGQAQNNPITRTFTVTLAPELRLVFSIQPVNTRASTSMANVVVSILRKDGLVDTTSSASITLTQGGANPNGGTLSGTRIVNAVNGVATFSGLSIDRVGSYALVASGPSSASAVYVNGTSNTFNITADRLTLAAQPVNTRASATLTALGVRATDGAGNVDSTYTGSVTLTLSTNPSTATFGGTLTLSASSGLASFSDLTINRVGVGYRMTASSGALTSVQSNTFNVIASELRFITQPSTTTRVGTNMAANPVVRATDSFGTADTTFNGAISISLGNNPNTATLSATALTVTASSGSATFNSVNLNKLGAAYTMLGSTSGYTSVTSTAFNITGDRLYFRTQPLETPAGVNINAVTVGLMDSFNNVDTTATPSVSLAIGTNPSGGTLTGGGAATAVAGVASYNGLSINNAGNGYTFVATATGLTSVTSTAFNITSCTTTIGSAGQTLSNGNYPTLCVTGSGGLTIPSTFSGTIGTLAISGATAQVTLNANVTFTNVSVASGTLTANTYDNLYTGTTWTNAPGAGNGKLVFTTGSLTVGGTGVITMDSKGYAGGISTKTQGGSVAGPGTSSSAANGGGGGTATYAASGSYGTTGSPGYRGTSAAPPSSTYGASDFTTALYLGSGGGFSQGTGSGAGGGAIGITANSVSIASGGQITARGGNGSFFNPGISGSGSGGTIALLNATSFSNAGGLVSVAGGSSNGLSGGYGRLHIPIDAIRNGTNTLNLTGLQGYALKLRSTDQISTMTLGTNSAILFTSDAGSSVDTVNINGSGAQFFINQNYTFSNVNLTTGTITALEYDNLYSGTTWTNAPAPGNGQLIFSVSGALNVGASGVIQMDAKGYFGGFSGKGQGGSYLSPGSTLTSNNDGGGGTGTIAGGGSYGTQGSQANAPTQSATYGASDFTNDAKVYLGSGGGGSNYGGGYGGGGIKITAGTISLTSSAQILARGQDGIWSNPWASGSGSGGTIVLNTTNLVTSGATISVAGGASYAPGGLGRISLPAMAAQNLANIVGWLQLEGSSAISTMMVGSGANIALKADTLNTIDTLTINGGTLLIKQALTLNTLNVTSGTLTSDGFDNFITGSGASATWTNSPGPANGRLILNVTGALTVGATGKIHMDAKGYAGGTASRYQGGSPTGPGTNSGQPNGGGGGGGGGGSANRGAGGSYGTRGNGNSWENIAIAGSVYGASDFASQLYLGSGGGRGVQANYNDYPGGAGGGAVQITAGSISNAGTISALGGSCSSYACGSGSGGTIVLSASSFTNTGTISVAGGTGGAIGGQGRISIPLSLLTDTNKNIAFSNISYYELVFPAASTYSTVSIGANSTVLLSAGAGAAINTLTINGSGAQVLLNQEFTFTTVNVTNGTLTAPAYDNLYTGTTWTNAPGTGNGRLLLNVTGSLTVGASGKIHMDSKGYAGGTYLRYQGGSPTGPGTNSGQPNGGGGGGGGGGSSNRGAGGSYGTRGNDWSWENIAIAGTVYGASDFATALYLGSGGGRGTQANWNEAEGGNGGGALKITAGGISNAGTISAVGGNSAGVAGGGSGGTIVLSASSFTNTGTISVAGGTGGGAGGQGRISIPLSLLTDASNNVALSNISYFELALPAASTYGTVNVGANSTVLLSAGAGTTINTLTINGSGAQVLLNQEFTFNTVNVTSGTLTAPAYDNLYSGTTWTNAPGPGNGRLLLNVNGTLTVANAGRIHMDSKGYIGGTYLRYQGGSPLGAGINSLNPNGGGGGGSGGASSAYGAGASYGSLGGAQSTSLPGVLYGWNDFTTALYLGSGGGHGIQANWNEYQGGFGGGAVKISAGTLANAGIISTVGGNGGLGGAGSGGTLILNTTNFSTSGTITAAGGTGGGGGGNGRSAISYTTCSGSFCPDKGTGTGTQFAPGFTAYQSMCQVSGGVTTCYGDTPSAFPPTSIVLTNPVSSPGTLRTPTLRLSGGFSWTSGRLVKVYSDSSCTQSVVSGSIPSGATTLDLTVPSLTKDGSYLFYATIVNESGNESGCSSAFASYVLSTSQASTPLLAAGTTSPGREPRPAFSATRSGGGSFAIDEMITLHEGADCSGAAVSQPLFAGNLSAMTIARMLAMSEGSVNFRARVLSSNGNTSCSNAVAYLYDNTPPTWSSSPSIADTDNPFNSLSFSPNVSFTQNGSDGTVGSGIARYEYAIGTGPRGGVQTAISNWTSITTTPFSVTGLSLANGSRYYVSMRAVDNVGLTSPEKTTSWIVDQSAPVAVTVAAAYTLTGGVWNVYVKNDGADAYSGSGTVCAGTEANLEDCLHSGEIRKVSLSPETSCEGLTIRDQLGAFDWTCRVQGGTAFAYSVGLKRGEYLRDLIDFSTGAGAFLQNRVIVTGGRVNRTYQSSLAVWWSNTFAALPANSAATTPTSLTQTANTILTLNSSRTTAGYSFGADSLVFTMPANVSLSWNNSAAANGSGRSIITAITRKFLWIEGTLAQGVATNRSQYGLDLRFSCSFIRVPFLNASGHLNNGVFITNNSTAVRFGDVITSSNGGQGFLNNHSSRSMRIDSITANSNTGEGVKFNSAVINGTIGSITANSNASYGVWLVSNDSVIDSITANSNTTMGLYVGGVVRTRIRSVTANSNTAASYGGVYSQNTNTDVEFGDVTANGNTANGFYMAGTNTRWKVTGTLTAQNNGNNGAYFAGNGHTVNSIVASGNGPANSAYSGVSLGSVTNSTFSSINSTANNGYGFYLTASTGISIGSINASNNLGSNGYGFVLGGVRANLTITGSTTANSNAQDGINGDASFCVSCTFGPITANSNGRYGVYGYFKNSTFGTFTTNSNSNHGIYLISGSTISMGNVTANSNTGMGLVLSAGSGYAVGDVTANSNLSATGGIQIASVSASTFGNLTANNNTGSGVVLGANVAGNSGVSFQSLTGNYNAGNGVSMWGNAPNANYTVTGAITANGNTSAGMNVGGTNHVFGDVYANNNGTSGVSVCNTDAGTVNVRFGRVVTNGNRGNGFNTANTNTGCTNFRLRSLVSSGNAGAGFASTIFLIGFQVAEYTVLNNNVNGISTVSFQAPTGMLMNNVLIAGNSSTAAIITGSQHVFNNMVLVNNAGTALYINTGSNNTFNNVVLTNNAGIGVQIDNTASNISFRGSLLIGNNGGANCSVAAGGTVQGLINTTCANTATDGTTSYTGQTATTAVLRTSRSLAGSFVGGLSQPGDDSNPSDGASGSGSGLAVFGSTTDLSNFDHPFRMWVNAANVSMTDPLNSALRGALTLGKLVRIYDWTPLSTDSVILNKTGDGSSANAAFTAGASCPSMVLGDQWIESQPYSYTTLGASGVAYTITGGLNGFQSAGSSTACTSGTTCVQRYLRYAVEIAGDSIGDDDGLCESNEACFYVPNFGAYQGHFDSMDTAPLADSTHQCTWSAYGGSVTGVTMYGFTRNGRQPLGTPPVWSSSVVLSSTSSTSGNSSPTITYTADANGNGTTIARYEYAVGTSGSGTAMTSILNWTTTPSTSFQVTGLSGLVPGTIYYVSLRAVNTNGQVSSVQSMPWLYVTAPTLSYAGVAIPTGRVNAPIWISPSSLASNGAPLTCAIKAGTAALPSGLSVNASTCVISGTPTVSASAATYTVVASNSAGTSADATVVITINPDNSLVDSDSSASGFGGGTHTGTQFVSGRLSLASGSDAQSQDLAASWTPKWSSVVGYWKLDGSGSIANGATVTAAVGTNGTVTNTNGSGMAYRTGEVNSGIYFDGVDDVVTIGNGTQYNTIGSRISIGAWIMITGATAPQRAVVSKYNAYNTTTNGLAWLLRVGTANTVEFWLNGSGSAVASTTVLVPGVWTHAMAVYDGSYRYMYINGVLEASSAITGSIIDTNLVPVRIGADGATGGEYFLGNIDDVAIWSDSLTASDVATIYSRQASTAKYRGTFLSRVFDLGTSSSWLGMKWNASLPFGKGLPVGNVAASSESSADYSALVGSNGTTSDNNLLSNLILNWNLNEPALGTVINSAGARDFADSSGNAFNIVQTGTIVPGQPGVIGNAIYLNGSTQYLTLADAAALKSASNLTGSIWIYPTRLQADDIIMGRWVESSNNRVWNLRLADALGNLTYTTAPTNGGGSGWSNATTTTSPIKINQWNHVVVRSDGSTNKIYVNGVEVASVSMSSAMSTTNTAAFQVGLLSYNGSNKFFAGGVDEVALWSRALNATEIQQLYRRGISRSLFRVRGCTTSNCSDNPSWLGPDGTSATFFSELQNNWVVTARGLPVGFFKPNAPNLLFNASSRFGTLSTPYLQYRVTLETDSSSLSDTPDVSNVTFIPDTGDVAPAVSVISNVSVSSGAGFGPLPVTITDPDDAVSTLSVSFSSSNEALVPSSLLSMSGTGTSRTISGATNAGTGTALIRVRIGDGTNVVETSFTVTVQ